MPTSSRTSTAQVSTTSKVATSPKTTVPSGSPTAGNAVAAEALNAGPVYSAFAGDRVLETIHNAGGVTLSPAYNGKAVYLYQQALMALGYELPGGADGRFGASTIQATKAFQADRGLKSDGSPGRDTIRAFAPAPVAAAPEEEKEHGFIDSILSWFRDDDEEKAEPANAPMSPPTPVAASVTGSKGPVPTKNQPVSKANDPKTKATPAAEAKPEEGKQDYAGIVLFPDYKVSVKDTWFHSILSKVGLEPPEAVKGLGHAGLLAIDSPSGKTKYAEYGRYADAQAKTPGVGRFVKVPDLDQSYAAKGGGAPSAANLDPLAKSLSSSSGQMGRAEIYLVDDVSFPELVGYMQTMIGKNHDKDKEAYDIMDNNCLSFVLDGVAEGGDEQPADLNLDPRPGGKNAWEMLYDRYEYLPTEGGKYTSGGPQANRG